MDSKCGGYQSGGKATLLAAALRHFSAWPMRTSQI
jgi:hypothetical protein